MSLLNGPWLIWSNEHTAWWNPNGNGYTLRVDEAGRYSFADALKICTGACHGCEWMNNVGFREPDEVMVPSAELIQSLLVPPAPASDGEDESLLCPKEYETATGHFDPAGYDVNDCAGCGCKKELHTRRTS